MSFLDVIFLVFAIYFIASSRPLKNEEGFGRQTTASLRGLAMVGIILHHIIGNFGWRTSLINPPGAMETGLFFFISGYGNMLSINKSEVVKTKWLIKKFFKIYLPFFTVYWICMILIMFCQGYSTNIKVVLIQLCTVTLPNQVSWFPKIILLCFSISWIAKRISNKIFYQNVIVLISLVVYIFLMNKFNYDAFWYNSVLCYSLGSIWAKSPTLDRILTAMKKEKFKSFLCMFVLFGTSFFISRKVSIIKILNPIFFSLLCYYFSYVFKVKTKFLAWIGNNSFEFYLIHLVWIQVFTTMLATNKYLFVFLVFALSIIFVYFYEVVEKKIKCGKAKRTSYKLVTHS